MISDSFFCETNAVYRAALSVFSEWNSRIVVNDEPKLCFMDGRHRQPAIPMLKEKESFQWTEDFFLHAPFNEDRQSWHHVAAEAIELRLVANTFTIIVRKTTSEVGKVKVLANYCRAFKLKYSLQYLDVRK